MPAWSPDGSTIAYVSIDLAVPDSNFIYVMNGDGTAPHRLTSGGALPEDSPSWSPGAEARSAVASRVEARGASAIAAVENERAVGTPLRMLPLDHRHQLRRVLGVDGNL
jgi:hypothetical protein